MDKQDDMPDFSKTDAYRSNKTRQSEDQASAPTQQNPSPGGQQTMHCLHQLGARAFHGWYGLDLQDFYPCLAGCLTLEDHPKAGA